MTEAELNRAAEQEASWLHYYGLREDREKELFEDAGFYDRLRSIGYTKRVIPLPMRCVCMYITSDRPVLESSIDELEPVSGPRNHDQNVFTALEYVLHMKVLDHEAHRTQLRD